MGNAANKKNITAADHEEKGNSECKWALHNDVPRNDYSQPVLLNDCTIILVPKNTGHKDDHRYVMLYDCKTDKYNTKWIKINKLCNLYNHICFTNTDKSKAYILGGTWSCFLQIDIKKKEIIEYIRNDMEQTTKSSEYNYQHPGEYAMVTSQERYIHIVGGSKSSKHLRFDTNEEIPQFETMCQSVFINDVNASYCEGGIIFNKLSDNLISFGGKRNKDFTNRIWISKKKGKNDGGISNWYRSRGKELPQKIHLFGYILMDIFVVLFGGKRYDGNNNNDILYCVLKENDDSISFQKLTSLKCPFSGECFAVLDDIIYNKIHLFHRKYHYTISSQFLSKLIIQQNEENKEEEEKEEKIKDCARGVGGDPLIVSNPLVILLGIKTYNKTTNLKDLQGTQLDIEGYRDCFENEYHYKVICDTDKYKWIGDEITDFFIAARKHLEDGLYDGLIVVIAGHGHKDIFIQSDGTKRGIDYYHEFFSCVWSDIISSLKIRLFIIDCCRGDIGSGTVKHHKAKDTKLFNIQSTRDRGRNDRHIDDLLVSIYGNSPGHQVKEDECGGLFSQSLVDVLNEKEAKLSLNNLLKKVKENLTDESSHYQLVNMEGDPAALFCVFVPNS